MAMCDLAILDKNNVGGLIADTLKLDSIKHFKRYMSRRGLDWKSRAKHFFRKLSCLDSFDERPAYPTRPMPSRPTYVTRPSKHLRKAELAYRDAQEELVSVTEDIPVGSPFERYKDIKVNFDEGEATIAGADGKAFDMKKLMSDDDIFDSEELALSEHEALLAAINHPDEEVAMAAILNLTEEQLSAMSDEQQLAIWGHISRGFKKALRHVHRATKHVAKKVHQSIRHIGNGFRKIGHNLYKKGHSLYRRVRRGGRWILLKLHSTFQNTNRPRHLIKIGVNLYKKGNYIYKKVKKHGRMVWTKVRKDLHQATQWMSIALNQGWTTIKNGWQAFLQHGNMIWRWTKQNAIAQYQKGVAQLKKIAHGISHLANTIKNKMKKLAIAVTRYFKCLGNSLKVIKKAYQRTYGYAIKRWMAFYKDQRNFDMGKFAQTLATKTWNGVSTLIKKMHHKMSEIRKGVRTVVQAFNKGYKIKHEIAHGSTEENELAEDIVSTALAEEEEYMSETALATSMNDENEVGNPIWSWNGIMSFEASVSFSNGFNFKSLTIGGGYFDCLEFFNLGCDGHHHQGWTWNIGFGIKPEWSAGVGANLFLWNSAEAVTGFGGSFSIGGDIPKTEIGANFVIQHSVGLPLIDALGFSIGVGISSSDMPVDVEYYFGHTWAQFKDCPTSNKHHGRRRMLSTTRNSEDENMSIDFEDDLASDSDSDDDMNELYVASDESDSDDETSIGSRLLDRYGSEIGVSRMHNNSLAVKQMRAARACPKVDNLELYAGLV